MDDARGDDRGQLILIAGIGIAVALVALALILNGLVFTQYLATKPTADGSEAIAYEHTVEDGVRGLVSEANYREYGPGVEAVVRNGVTGNWSTSLTRQYGASGTLVNVSVEDVETGTSIHQDEPRRFTNATRGGNWTPIEGANGVRGFQLTVTNASAASPEQPFRLNVTLEGGFVTPVEVYADPDGTGVVLNDTTEEDTVISVSTPATIDFSNGSVNGRSTDQLAFYDGPNVTGVAVANGERAVGKYVAVANHSGADDVTSAGDYQPTTDRSPYAVSAVYATTLHATYVAPDVTYGTSLRVAPNAFGAGPNGLRPEYGVYRLPSGVVFTYSDWPTNLSVTNATGVDPQRLPQTGVQVAGPHEYDFTDDNVLDVPYVVDGSLYLANESGSIRLATNPAGAPSLLAVGFWNGSAEPSVFYTGSGNTVYQVRPGETSTPVFSDTNNGVSAVVGTGDVDADGADEFIYLGGSQQLRYIDRDGTHHEVDSGGAGQNQGIGAGAPVDIDGDGVDRIPFVDGSNNLILINDMGSTKVLSQAAAKSPVTAYDVDDDGTLELVYLNQNGRLSYADNVTGSPTANALLNASGQEVFGSKKVGVA